MTSKFKQIGYLVKRESPTIFTGLGVLGVFSTVGLAIKATGPALGLIYQEKHMRAFHREEPSTINFDLSAKEILELTWKLYVPTAISGGITIACIVASNRVSLRRNAALMSLYSVSEVALQRYQAEVLELVGKNKAEKIRENVAQRQLNEDPLNDEEVFLTGAGNHLFFDALSGRYFRTDIETVRKSINSFNEELLNDMYSTLNDFYYELGIEGTEMGRNMGWNVDEYRILEVKFTTKIATNGEPCIVLNYPIMPRYL
jgi:hypothetical protein